MENKEKQLVIVSSVTYAMKGKQLLGKYGIRAEVIKTPRNTAEKSCTYSLLVYKDIDRAERILTDNGIKVLGRAQRRGGV